MGQAVVEVETTVKEVPPEVKAVESTFTKLYTKPAMMEDGCNVARPKRKLAGSDGSSDGACGCEKVPRVDAMTKLSLALKQENALGCVCRALPSAWPKLRKTSKLYMWRLDELKLHALQQALIEELNLVFADLFELCERGDAECVWILLSQGMNVKQRDPEGATLLQKATHSGCTTILKLIVEKGGVLNAKGSYGYTPLHEACYLGVPEVCELLLSVKANVDALSKNGSTPLLVAGREGHNAICESLLKHNADADDGGDKGWTPLSVAAGEGHVEVCETLLKYNANVHGFSGDGRYERSALQEAAEQGHANVVGLLLEAKADVHHTFDEGGGQQRRWTAAELAERAGHSKIVNMLMSQVMAPNCFFVALQTSSDGLLHVMHDPEATDFLFQSSSEARCSEDPKVPVAWHWYACRAILQGMPKRPGGHVYDPHPCQDVSSDTEDSVELETPSGTCTTAAELGPDGLPSIGSVGHATGDCKRCCFHPKGRCQNGHDCRFCHFDHDKRRRAGTKKKSSRQVSPDSSMTGDGISPVLTPAMGQQPMALIPGPQAPCQPVGPCATTPSAACGYPEAQPHMEAPQMAMGCMEEQVGYAPPMMPNDYGNMPMWQGDLPGFMGPCPLSTAPQGPQYGWPGPPNFFAPRLGGCRASELSRGQPIISRTSCRLPCRYLEQNPTASEVLLGFRFQFACGGIDYLLETNRSWSDSILSAATGIAEMGGDVRIPRRQSLLGTGPSEGVDNWCPVCSFEGARVIRASLARDNRSEAKKSLLPGLAPSEIMEAAGRNIEFWVRQKALESSRRRKRCLSMEERLVSVTQTAEDHIQQSQKQREELAQEEADLEKRLQMLVQERSEVSHQIEQLKREFLEADEQRSCLDLQVGGSVRDVLQGRPMPERRAPVTASRLHEPQLRGGGYSFEGAGLRRSRSRSPGRLANQVEAGLDDFFVKPNLLERCSEKEPPRMARAPASPSPFPDSGAQAFRRESQNLVWSQKLFLAAFPPIQGGIPQIRWKLLLPWPPKSIHVQAARCSKSKLTARRLPQTLQTWPIWTGRLRRASWEELVKGGAELPEGLLPQERSGS
ncbi:ANKRD50 [Symbiodinium natans]|uniref:ANKRD50 protein n=1 Tax=Symbiodinium natans TaxID=878477 RepID=A0A812QNK5_9DINO|nr:ANKRD50 [Symbiodinium natans]